METTIETELLCNGICEATQRESDLEILERFKDAIVNRDAKALEEILDEDSAKYCDKYTFLELYINKMNNFEKQCGALRIVPVPVFCMGCRKGNKGYRYELHIDERNYVNQGNIIMPNVLENGKIEIRGCKNSEAEDTPF